MRIHKYEIDTVVTDDDILLGTDKDNPGNITKNFRAAAFREFVGGVSEFTALTDTPSSYAGQAGLVPYVNAEEDALEFKGFVDKISTEVIGGLKTFSSPLNIRENIIYDLDAAVSAYASGGASGYEASGYYFTKNASAIRARLNVDQLTTNRTFIFPDRGGEFGIVSAGNFTVTLTDDGAGGTYTIGSQNTEYYRIGDLVFFNIRISGIGHSGSPSGNFVVGGLPFNQSSVAITSYTVGTFTGATSPSWYSIVGLSRNANSKDISFKIQTSLDANHDLGFMQGVQFAGSVGAISMSGCYITEDA